MGDESTPVTRWLWGLIEFNTGKSWPVGSAGCDLRKYWVRSGDLPQVSPGFDVRLGQYMHPPNWWVSCLSEPQWVLFSPGVEGRHRRAGETGGVQVWGWGLSDHRTCVTWSSTLAQVCKAGPDQEACWPISRGLYISCPQTLPGISFI